MDTQQIERWVDSAVAQGYSIGFVTMQRKVAQLCVQLLKDDQLGDAAWKRILLLLNETPKYPE